MSHLQNWIIMLSQLTLAFTSPIYAPRFLSGGIGMNIRTSPCVSSRTGETGVCMFATTCERANGTHLSTCIDRFYFGSCCKLYEDAKVHPQENTITVGFVQSPFVTTDKANIENTDIPEDYPRPEPIVEKQPVTSTTSTSNQTTFVTKQSFLRTPYTTMQPPIGLTFPSVHNYSQGSSSTVTTDGILQGSSSSSAITQKPSITESATFIMTNGELSRRKPTSSTSIDINSPGVIGTTTKTISSVHNTKTTVIKNPVISSTQRPLSSMTERNRTSTRFPPRNATTKRPIDVTTMTLKVTTLATSLIDGLDKFDNSSSSTSAITKISGRPQQPNTTKPSSSSLSTLNVTPSMNHTSATSIASLVFNETILTDEISLPLKVPTVVNIEENTLSTYSPWLITWSSYFNYEVTKAPDISFTPTATSQEEKPTNNSASTESNWSSASTISTTRSTIAAGGNVAGLPVPTDNFNMSDYKQVCGMRLLPESRIVGGGPSTFGKWPWQLSLQVWNTTSSVYEHSCGAVLLTDNWAITVAHCVENVRWKHLLLRIGDHDMDKKDEHYESQERRVHFVFHNPQFNPFSYEYDLALLRFDKPLEKFQPHILPICLPDNDEYYVGHTAFVTGWGRLHHNGRLPHVLHEVSVPVISNTVCERMYKKAGYKERIANIFICAGQRKGGVDSCEGDSGGPMMIQRASDKRWILVGVITWGIGCGLPNQPGVYTRISKFRKWITESTQLIDDAYLEAKAFV